MIPEEIADFLDIKGILGEIIDFLIGEPIDQSMYCIRILLPHMRASFPAVRIKFEKKFKYAGLQHINKHM